MVTDAPPDAPQGARGGRRANRRGGGRSGNARRSAPAVSQYPWTLPVNSDRPTEPLTEEGVQAVHDGAMRILEEIGIQFLHPDAVDILRRAGCTVDEDGVTVRMGRDFVMEMIAKAPTEFTVTPRNPDRELTIGGKHMIFQSVASPPNYSNLDEGRKVGTRKAHADLVKLAQYFNCIHQTSGYTVEPLDIHPSVRHLECLYDKILFTDKVLHAYALGKERIEDVMEMVRIGSGLTHEEFDAKPRMYTNINSTSPLKHDHPMLDGLMRMSRRGQPTYVTPFTLAGAMAPVTLAGTVAQSCAEALCAIALIQVIKPGCPAVMGTFSSNVDMKTGAPAFGTPDYMRATQMTGQMARFYGLPLRASNVCAANTPDAQAAWESAFSLWACVSAGVNTVYHAAGWLEGGLCASYEKFVMDCDTLQQMSEYMKPVSADVDDIALDAIREVGHGGHFFGVQHTQDRYETAFYSPFISDWSNFENWRDNGAVQTPERANKIWKQILAEFEPPPLDEAIKDELTDFVARRTAEGGAPTDY
ncbi:MAG: trimethylamine methyltransferase family protein [Pseudomonadota bacterium]